jgi:gas vesicle structural protein
MALHAVTDHDRYLGTRTPSRLSDVVDLILDQGLVIDFYARACLMDFEIATLDGRIVVAGIDTYLRLADAIGRLAASDTSQSQ